MDSDYQTYAAAKMAEYAQIAAAASLVRQAQRQEDGQADAREGWAARLMMSLGFRTPTIEHAGV
jgi:hypothetical protein